MLKMEEEEEDMETLHRVKISQENTPSLNLNNREQDP